MIKAIFNSLPPVKDNYYSSQSKSFNHSNSKQLQKVKKNNNSQNNSRSDQDFVIQSPISRNNEPLFQSFNSSQRSFFSSLQQSYSGLSKNNDNSVGSFQDQYFQSFATERQKRVIKIQKMQEQKNKTLLNFSQFSQEENEVTYEKINIVNSLSNSLRLGNILNKTKSDTIFLATQEIAQPFNQKQVEQHIDLVENSKQTIEIPSKKYIYARINILNQHLPLRFSCESDKEDYQIYFSFYDYYPNKNNSITIPSKRKSHLYKVGNETIQTKYFYFSFHSEIKVQVRLKVWFNEKIFENFRHSKESQMGLKAQQKEFQRQLMKKIMEDKKLQIQEKERTKCMMLEQIREEKFQGQEVEESILRFYLNQKLKEQQKQEYIEKNKLVIQNTQVKGMWENREQNLKINPKANNSGPDQRKKNLRAVLKVATNFEFDKIYELNYSQNTVQKNAPNVQHQEQIDQSESQKVASTCSQRRTRKLPLKNASQYQRKLESICQSSQNYSTPESKAFDILIYQQLIRFINTWITPTKILKLYLKNILLIKKLFYYRIIFEGNLKGDQWWQKFCLKKDQKDQNSKSFNQKSLLEETKSAKNGICKEYISRQLRDLKARLREARDQKQQLQISLKHLYLIKERQQLMDILLNELEALKERYGSEQQGRIA
ncbi:hypothetical protein ABPG74_021747 [Tetrahymena malaccensis]